LQLYHPPLFFSTGVPSAGTFLLIAAGCDMKESSGKMVHSRAGTTLDIYTHLSEKVQQTPLIWMREAIKKLGKR